MIQLGQRHRKPSFISGEQQEYEQLASSIRTFEPSALEKNESYLKEKVLKNKGFTKSLFDKRDFVCLATILNTNFATFRQRIHRHGELQNQFIHVQKENTRQEQMVADLRREVQELEDQNERLKSKILSKHEENIRVYENSQQQVVVEEHRERVGQQDSGRMRKLVEVEGDYVGQRDLPVFVQDLVGTIRKVPQPSSREMDFSFFGENFKPQKVDLFALSKLMGEKGLVKNQSYMKESEVRSMWPGREEQKRPSSMPKESKRVENLLPAPSIRTTKKIFCAEIAQRDLFNQSKNPEEKPALQMPQNLQSRWVQTKNMVSIRGGLQSKYVGGKNQMINLHDPGLLSFEPFDIAEMKHERITNFGMLKNNLKKK